MGPRSVTRRVGRPHVPAMAAAAVVVSPLLLLAAARVGAAPVSMPVSRSNDSVSIEHIVATADLVVRGDVLHVDSEWVKSDWSPREYEVLHLRVRVVEVLRVRPDVRGSAPAPPPAEFVLRGLSPYSFPARPAEGEQWLLAMRREGWPVERLTVASSTGMHPGGGWAWAYPLADPVAGRPVTIHGLRTLTRADELLAAARAAAAASAEHVGRAAPPTVRLVMPRDAPAAATPGERRAVLVPGDGSLLAAAEQWARSPSASMRSAAAEAMAVLAMPELWRAELNIGWPDLHHVNVAPPPGVRAAAERGLLALARDDLAEPDGRGIWPGRYHPVRRTARDLLTFMGYRRPDLGAAAARVTLHEPSHHPIPRVDPLAAIAAGGLLAFAWAAGRRLGRRSPMLRPTAFLSLALTAAFAALLWRSHRTADEVAFARGPREHEVASHRGHLRYLLVADWPGGDRAALLTRPVGTALDRRWEPSSLAYRHRRSIAGLSIGTGTTEAPAGSPWPRLTFWTVSIPHVAVFPLVAAPALLAMRAALRAWDRRRRGRCLQCGYDLRGSPGGVCPECGAAAEGHGTPIAACEQAVPQLRGPPPPSGSGITSGSPPRRGPAGGACGPSAC